MLRHRSGRPEQLDTVLYRGAFCLILVLELGVKDHRQRAQAGVASDAPHKKPKVLGVLVEESQPLATILACFRVSRTRRN